MGGSSILRDLIFVSMEDWDEVWRRNQFFCATLARRHPEMKILFVGTQRNIVQSIRRGAIAPLFANPVRTVDGLPNLTVTRPLRFGPETYQWGRKLNEWLIRTHVRSVARRMGLRPRPVLWLNPHYGLHMAGELGESAVIYDITDDWTEFEQPDALAARIRAQDAALCRRADATIVCSERLYQLKEGMAKSLHLIPNGVDFEHYLPVLDGTGPLLEETRGWRRPVLGYVGTVHPDRVDVALVESVARAMPEATIVLVGPLMLPASVQAQLRVCGNVVMTGAVPYARVPEYLRAFDVCLTPHRVTAFTESLNPIKLWEYLAAGKPMVATNVAGFRDYPQWVRLAANTNEFLAAIRDALGEAANVGRSRRDSARDHSWNSRVDAVEAVLEAALQSAPGKALTHV